MSIRSNEHSIKSQVMVQLTIVLLTISLGVFGGWVSFNSDPNLIVNELPESHVSVINLVSTWTPDYTIADDGAYNISSIFDTPFLYMNLSNVDMNINTIAIIIENFKDAFSENASLMGKIALPDDVNTLNELNQSVEYSRDGQTLIFQMPEFHSNVVCVSIRGNFKLKDIIVSKDKPIKTIVPNEFSLSYCYFPCLLAFLCCELLWFLRCKLLYLLMCIRNNAHRIMLLICAIALGVFFSYLFGAVIFTFVFRQEYFYHRIILCCSMGGVISALLFLRKTIAHRPEYAYLAVALCLGLTFSLIMPIASWVTWDDQIHYKNMLNMVYGGNARITAADDDIINRHFSTRSSYDDHRKSLVHASYLNSIHKNGAVYKDTGSFIIQFLIYLPFMVGIWLGRLIQMPFSSMFVLGRVLNLMVSVMIFFLAMRQLKSGKMLVAVIALLPTAVFQMCNCSSDGIIHSFLTLGVAMFISEIQDEKRELSIQKEICSLCIFIFGMLNKPIYFPLLFMLLFMPKHKFKNTKQRKLYYEIIILGIFCCILLLATFVLQNPKVLSDKRGGSTVNGWMQIVGILKDPFGYAAYLLKYLFKEYLNPANSDSVFSYVGYYNLTLEQHAMQMYGNFHNGIILLVLLLFVSVTGFSYNVENGLSDGENRWMHFGVGFSVFVCIALIATTMYITYNPVGYREGTINGVQGRYLLPLLFAGFSTIHLKNIRASFPGKAYNGILLVLMLIVFYSGIWGAMPQAL